MARNTLWLGIVVAAVTGCSLLTSLDDLTGTKQPPPSVDSGAPVSNDAGNVELPDASDSAAQIDTDAASDAEPAIPISCAQLKQWSPGTPDGAYTIDPDGSGPLPAASHYCDMTQDVGGWMLVTPDLIDSEKSNGVTIVRGTDPRGGFSMTVYGNDHGCTGPSSWHVVYLKDLWGWTQVRAKYKFDGYVSCWGIFGSNGGSGAFDTHLLPFDATYDILRSPIRMGGSNGDAFGGKVSRCDNQPDNFWCSTSPERSAIVALRKDTVPGGLGTFTTCITEDAGTGSPTFWSYSEVYVR